MKSIPLTQGLAAIVDNDDFHRLQGFNWQLHIGGGRKGRDGRWFYAGYYQRIAGPCRKYLKILMHRLILDIEDPTLFVDHIDGNGLNNQRSNLRIATRVQNNRNCRLYRSNTSGVKGVQMRINDSGSVVWRPMINIDGKRRCLGTFQTKDQAIAVRRAAENEHYGEFARVA